MQRQTPRPSRERWGNIQLLIQPERLMQRAPKRRRNKKQLIVSVAHLTRYFLPILKTQAFSPTPMDSCFPSPFATPPTVGAGCPPLAPPPHPRRLTWIQRSEVRHRGDFRSLKSGGEAISPCPISVARSTRRAGQGCRLFLSPKKSTCAAGVLVTTFCYVLGPGHGV